MIVGGCEKVDTSEPEEPAEVDTSNAEQVAEAIWLAIKEKDYERVREYVVPRKRNEITLAAIEEELRELPPLPESMMIGAAGTPGKGRAHAFVLNWDSSQGSSPMITLTEEDGRWWILRL